MDTAANRRKHLASNLRPVLKAFTKIDPSVGSRSSSTFGAPDENGYLPPGTCNALYDYYPSSTSAVAFAGIFGVLTLIHIIQALFYKKVFDVLFIPILNTEIDMSHRHIVSS